jgi:hypothetical protein
MSRLSRRTPLRRGAPLSRSELRPGPPPVRRTRLRPVSRRREDDRPERDGVQAFVFYRDGLRCRLENFDLAEPVVRVPRCVGPLTVHHVRKAGQGGPYVPLNLVALCAGHNDWLETADGATWGRGRGLVARRGDDLIECWARMRAAGIVEWNHAGE